MADRTERARQVLRQHPDISPLATDHPAIERGRHLGRGFQPDQFQTIDLDAPRLAHDFLAGAGKLVERLAALLDRGEHRGHLQGLAEETAHRRLHLRDRERRHRCPLDHLPFGIAGRRAGTQGDRETIDLAPLEDLARHFGRLAETDRQHAGGERIETADMAGFGRTEQPPDP